MERAEGQCLLYASVILQYELLCTGGLETVASSRWYGYLESCCTLPFWPLGCMEHLLLRPRVSAIDFSAAEQWLLFVSISNLEERSNAIDFSKSFQPHCCCTMSVLVQQTPYAGSQFSSSSPKSSSKSWKCFFFFFFTQSFSKVTHPSTKLCCTKYSMSLTYQGKIWQKGLQTGKKYGLSWLSWEETQQL